MTQITGNEPPHWHRTLPDGSVVHNMTDPRTIPGWIPAHMDRDEKMYVQHLEQHERDEDPTFTGPLPMDPPLVLNLLELMAAERAKHDALTVLIQKSRRIRAQGTKDCDNEALNAIAESLGKQASSAGTGS